MRIDASGLILTSLVFATLALNGCSQKKTETPPPAQQAAPPAAAPATEKVEYTCTMHPEVRQTEPGKCPKCGMDLVRVDQAEKPAR